MDAAGVGPRPFQEGSPPSRIPNVLGNMIVAPVPAPQRKIAKARKTRAANAILRDFKEPNCLEGAIFRACFKLPFTYQN